MDETITASQQSTKQSPIFSKSYDLLLWLLVHTEKFPKSERFRLARRLDDSMFEFYHLLLTSTRARQARVSLEEADLQLDKVRLYVRLCHARGYFDGRQYEFSVNSMMEIGRLLGGWIKSLPAPAANPGDTGKGAAGRRLEQQQR